MMSHFMVLIGSWEWLLLVIYGRKFQTAMTMMSYMVRNPNQQWIVMSLPDYDVIFGGESQPAVDSDVTSCHKAI